MAMGEEMVVAVASEVAKKATESVYDFIQRHISYAFKHQSYLNDLKNRVEDLGYARERVEHQVDEAKRRGEEIEKDVEHWLKRVDDFNEGVVKPINDDETKTNKRCFNMMCPNLIKRYMLGKKAAKAALDGTDLCGKRELFIRVSYRPTLQRTESVLLRGYEAFDSRIQVLQDIKDTLKDANVNMIGVHGMAGVGKTTLVKKVASLAKENKLFDAVAVAEVTETPDYKKIQEKIAFDLGLEFRQEGEYDRVGLLRSRIEKEKNLLIILDDIWTKLDFDAIGIPFGDATHGICL
ncbi:hypothetical protein Pint_19506 [Pistacia integerrima]|uniref:Uncharacterized protein n=1 Tax=Pistacia integerrima TaxID=434235 RepID=A0ACC0YVF9_9ROSI|nr:hypothetical protein Pint_19506 [Pistacia integerrima]